MAHESTGAFVLNFAGGTNYLLIRRLLPHLRHTPRHYCFTRQLRVYIEAIIVVQRRLAARNLFNVCNSFFQFGRGGKIMLAASTAVDNKIALAVTKQKETKEKLKVHQTLRCLRNYSSMKLRRIVINESNQVSTLLMKVKKSFSNLCRLRPKTPFLLCTQNC